MTATSKKKATAGTSKEISTRKKSTSSGRPRSTSASWTHPASLPMNTRVIQMVKTPHTVVNHSYVDYSLVPPGPEDKNRPKQIQQMDFHQKLYSILGRDDLKDIIGWLPHGRAFRVNVPSRFEKVVCQEYFRHTRYSSFLYQLGLHGYKQISTGRDRGAYYSPLLLRGLPHMTKYMPNPKEFRHLIQDPDNEPDFYLIQFITPLPDDEHFGEDLTIQRVTQFCQDHGRPFHCAMRQLQEAEPEDY